jgi:hypothetical protein
MHGGNIGKMIETGRLAWWNGAWMVQMMKNERPAIDLTEG